jgi:hypothetical protein
MKINNLGDKGADSQAHQVTARKVPQLREESVGEDSEEEEEDGDHVEDEAEVGLHHVQQVIDGLVIVGAQAYLHRVASYDIVLPPRQNNYDFAFQFILNV